MTLARSTASTGTRRKFPKLLGLSTWRQKNGTSSGESTGKTTPFFIIEIQKGEIAVQNTCHHRNESFNFCRYYMYHSKQNSLVWCKVPKAGSSTWTYNFLKLAGVNPKEVTTNFVAVTIMIFVFSENPQSSEGSLSKAGQQQSHASEWKFQKC